jgi:hypothetical protein
LADLSGQMWRIPSLFFFIVLQWWQRRRIELGISRNKVVFSFSWRLVTLALTRGAEWSR